MSINRFAARARAIAHPRRAAAAGLGCAVVTGLAVRAIVPPGWFSKYCGDACWAVGVYCVVGLVAPLLSPRRTALIAACVAAAVELAQLTPGPAWLASKHVLFRLAFGAVFNSWDLLAYAVGIGAAFGIHNQLMQSTRREPPAPQPSSNAERPPT